jgi:hypothetical protein
MKATDPRCPYCNEPVWEGLGDDGPCSNCKQIIYRRGEQFYTATELADLERQMQVQEIQGAFWRAVAKGIDSEYEKASLFTKNRQALGLAREAIIRDLLSHQTPHPLRVSTGFIVGREGTVSSGQCDILVYDPRRAQPVYATSAFDIVPDLAAAAAIEVKTELDNREWLDVIRLWQTARQFPVQFLAFGYDGPPFANFLKLLAGSIAPDKSVLGVPDFVVVHYRNYFGFRQRPRMACTPQAYFAVDCGHGQESGGAAAGWFFRFYDEWLRADNHAYHLPENMFNLNIPAIFEDLPQEAKAWIDTDGQIHHGQLGKANP